MASHLTVLLAALSLALPVHAQTTERVSVRSNGDQGDWTAHTPAISADGRIVAFVSDSTNLVVGDTNGNWDIFVHDRQTAMTTRISVDSLGVEADGASWNPSLSGDGRYVAFYSEATNLVPGDTNAADDVFVHDRLTGATTRVSVDSLGLQTNYLSQNASISEDGRYVAFDSFATNLVPGDTNGTWDVFVHDRVAGLTLRASVGVGGAQATGESYAPSFSGDGRHVAFVSAAANLVAGDTNGRSDVFVRDLLAGTTSRVSLRSNGAQADDDSAAPSLSRDGRYAAFDSYATNLVAGDSNGAIDVFLHDRVTGITSRIVTGWTGAQSDSNSYAPAVSGDGRWVAFESEAANLVPGDANGAFDVFVYDRVSGVITRDSVGPGGAEASGGGSVAAAISHDGGAVVFDSEATNLVPGDTNLQKDVFVHGRNSVAPQLARHGSCPGQIVVVLAYASPLGNVALVYGSAGSHTQNSPPCAGLTLGISNPTLGVTVRATAAGTVTRAFPVPAGLCGKTLQAVDLATCIASNPVVL